jgi:acyl carrier protein
MSEIFSKIEEGLQEIFPEIGDMEIATDTQLEEIPDWDSMNAVNLHSYLEQTFNITLPEDLLDDEMTIGELITFIEQPDKTSTAA